MKTLATNDHERGKGLRAFAAVFSLLFLFSAELMAAEVMVGKLQDIRGEVEVQRRGQADWDRAVNGMTVNPGDQINTGIGGSAHLIYANSVTEIQPLTQFVVGRVFEDGKQYTTELFLQVGKVVSNVNPKSGKENRFTVTTPSAVAGVRGTRQECSYASGYGTEVKITDGTGYMAPVKAEKLPPAVQALLGVAPAGGGREGGVGKGDEKKDDKGTKGRGDKGEAATPAEAVAAFNEWIAAASEAKGGEEAAMPVLDAATLDYVMPISDGLSASVTDARDPTATTDALSALTESATTSVLPAGSTEAEDRAALTSTEVVDAPVTVTVQEAAETVRQAVEVQTSTTSSTSTSVTPPNRPTTGQSQGQ